MERWRCWFTGRARTTKTTATTTAAAAAAAAAAAVEAPKAGSDSGCGWRRRRGVAAQGGAAV